MVEIRYHKPIFLVLIMGILLISLVSANIDIQTWQGKYLTGEPLTTYTFNFTVYDDIIVGAICYSSSVDLTTDSDKWWYVERTGVLASCSNPSENYYLNINIDGVDQSPRRLLKQLKYADLSLDTNFTQNVNVVGNLTLRGKIKFTFEEFIDNLVDGWLRITGNLNVTGNVTANYFIGNLNWSDVQNAPIGDWLSTYNVSYWDTSNDLDGVISTDEITELKIDFNTVCGVGNHLYVSGNNLACEADDDTTYLGGTSLTLDGSTFNVDDNFIKLAGDSTGALTSDLNIDSNTLVISYDDNRIGIGTASPSANIDIGGNSDSWLLRGHNLDNDNKNSFIFWIGADEDVRLNLYDATETLRVTLNSDGDTYFTGGNVGIGTDSPVSKLEVNGAGGIALHGGDSDFIINSDKAFIYQTTAGGTYPFNDFGNLILQSRIHASNSGKRRDIVFVTSDTSTPKVRMVIKYDGKVGIGTDNPQSKLHVDGDIRIQGLADEGSGFVWSDSNGVLHTGPQGG